ESSTITLPSPQNSPPARTASRTPVTASPGAPAMRRLAPPQGGGEELGRLAKSLQADLADALEAHAVGPGCHLDDGPRHEHLSAGRACDHARGLVHLPPVVVAVAVERLAVVDADARRRLSPARSLLEAHRPAGQCGGVGADDHHLVPQ